LAVHPAPSVARGTQAPPQVAPAYQPSAPRAGTETSGLLRGRRAERRERRQPLGRGARHGPAAALAAAVQRARAAPGLERRPAGAARQVLRRGGPQPEPGAGGRAPGAAARAPARAGCARAPRPATALALASNSGAPAGAAANRCAANAPVALSLASHQASTVVRRGARPVRRAGGRVATLKPALLAALLRAPGAVAQRLVGLRCALPACDVKELVLRDPALLLRVRAAQAGLRARRGLVRAARVRGWGDWGACVHRGAGSPCKDLPGACGHLRGYGFAEAGAFCRTCLSCPERGDPCAAPPAAALEK